MPNTSEMIDVLEDCKLFLEDAFNCGFNQAELIKRINEVLAVPVPAPKIVWEETGKLPDAQPMYKECSQPAPKPLIDLYDAKGYSRTIVCPDYDANNVCPSPCLNKDCPKHAAFVPARRRLYIDGACSGNPGPGGYAVVEDGVVTRCGWLPRTTNNEMELHAALAAVSFLPAGSKVTIITDSRNVIGWLTGTYQINVPHIAAAARAYFNLVREMNIDVAFEKVLGHSGEPNNEMADREAKWQVNIAKLAGSVNPSANASRQI